MQIDTQEVIKVIEDLMGKIKKSGLSVEQEVAQEVFGEKIISEIRNIEESAGFDIADSFEKSLTLEQKISVLGDEIDNLKRDLENRGVIGKYGREI